LDIADAVTADEIKNGSIEGAILPIERFLTGLPRAYAPAEQREKLFNGAGVPFDAPDMPTACIYAGEELIGIGSVFQGIAKIKTRLVGA
jgi:hypothetical protein